MRIVAEVLQIFNHIFVDKGMSHDAGIPRFQLGSRWKVAVDEEVGNFKERRILGQILDIISAIPQNPLIAVDVADCGFTDSSVQVARIVHTQANLGQKRRFDSVVLDQELDCCAGLAVCCCEVHVAKVNQTR